jgi:pantoate--beta-alanine ligase
MKIIKSIPEMHEHCKQLKRDGKTIASLNTGGVLHDGHVHLINIAKDNADVVIVMLDHPIEFFTMDSELYDKYYKEFEADLDEDIDLCKKHGVDVFFVPSMSDMYGDRVTKITISNPFVKGVIPQYQKSPIASDHMLSYIKEFNISMPDVCVLGQKDIHQTMSTISMIKDFNFPIKPIIVPIIREPDGLACSSRNRLLSPSQRQEATSVYQTLHEISRWSVYPPVAEIKEHITKRINQANGEIDYIQICCFNTLKNLDVLDRKALVIVNAIWGGQTEIGDNIIIEP